MNHSIACIVSLGIAGVAFLALAVRDGHPSNWFMSGFALGTAQAMLQVYLLLRSR